MDAGGAYEVRLPVPGGGEAEGLPEICVSYGILCALLFCYNGTVWSLYAAFAARAEAALRGGCWRGS